MANQSSDGSDDFAMVGGGLIVLAVFAVVGALKRFMRWRKPDRPERPVRDLPTESAQRLERLEQGMEAIAIEIERVSEGQRFVTRLLSESRAPGAVPHRIAEPALVEQDRPGPG